MKEAVQVVILNEDGEVLAVSRKHDHNDFGLVGGKVDNGESPIQAIIRETKEETGLTLYEGGLFPIFQMHKNGYMSYTYLVKVYDGNIHTDENHVVKWTSFNTVIDGSFGEWNYLVAESLISMGIDFDYVYTKKNRFENYYQYDWSYSTPKKFKYGSQGDWNVTIITKLNLALVESNENTDADSYHTIYVPIKYENIFKEIITYNSEKKLLFDKWKIIYISNNLNFIYSDRYMFKVNILNFKDKKVATV